jgi:hypothetical protein
MRARRRERRRADIHRSVLDEIAERRAPEDANGERVGAGKRSAHEEKEKDLSHLILIVIRGAFQEGFPARPRGVPAPGLGHRD